jgi:hypothetical protein
MRSWPRRWERWEVWLVTIGTVAAALVEALHRAGTGHW